MASAPFAISAETTTTMDQHAPQAPMTDLIRFYHLLDTGLRPQRADRSAVGLLPTRAFRFCEAVTTASAFGWYVFPPTGFKLMWSGTDVLWSHDEDREWKALVRAQYPGFAPRFDEGAPEAMAGMSPPFLGVLPEPGVVQVWCGLMVRTRPGVSLLVRAPANIPKSGPYEMYEGIVETDRWFGPLFINIRITKTDTEIYFDPAMPLFQLQPLPRDLYLGTEMNHFDTHLGVAGFEEREWADYAATVGKSLDAPLKPMGTDAIEVRKRRKAEVE